MVVRGVAVSDDRGTPVVAGLVGLSQFTEGLRCEDRPGALISNTVELTYSWSPFGPSSFRSSHLPWPWLTCRRRVLLLRNAIQLSKLKTALENLYHKTESGPRARSVSNRFQLETRDSSLRDWNRGASCTRKCGLRKQFDCEIEGTAIDRILALQKKQWSNIASPPQDWS